MGFGLAPGVASGPQSLARELVLSPSNCDCEANTFLLRSANKPRHFPRLSARRPDGPGRPSGPLGFRKSSGALLSKTLKRCSCQIRMQ